MAPAYRFHTDTPLVEGLRQLFERLEERLSLTRPVNVYLAGGMAVHLYTGARVTTDVDAEFGSKVLLPNDLVVEVTMEDGTREPVYFDTNYSPTFALLHEDYQDDAIALNLGTRQLRLHLLSPVDLAVSKIARFADVDREDIAALVELGLTSADEIEQRAEAALAGYVGGLEMVTANLREAIGLAHTTERRRTQGQVPEPCPSKTCGETEGKP